MLTRERILDELAATRQANTVLQEHTEELERSNSELEQFAYIASHDLQEPLRMVASYTQLLGKRYADKYFPAPKQPTVASTASGPAPAAGSRPRF